MPIFPAHRSQLPRAAFDYTVTADHILVITDQGNPKSVTNDIGNVLADIAHLEEWASLAGYRSVYADSAGDWAGVQLDPHGRFAGFFGLGRRVTDEQGALARVRELRPTL